MLSTADVLESGASLWEAGVPLYTEVTPRALALHHPVDHFVRLATASFSRFVTRDELVARKALAEPRPIGEFGRFVDQVGDGYSDVLLLA